MSEHKVNIEWEKTSDSFDYDQYNREHAWIFDNGIRVQASAAPQFKGKEGHIDPEEAFVASVASCHMLTFLAIASKKKWIVESYTDEPVGELSENNDGQLAMTKIVLRPQIVFSSDKQPSQEEIRKLHDKAHMHCFIAHSIRTDVEII